MASLQVQAALLLTIGAVAACGGGKNRPGAADTAGAAAVTPDSATAPAPSADTAAKSATADSAMNGASDSGAKATADTAKKQATTPSPKPAAKPVAKRPAAPAPAKQMAAAESTKAAAPPTPAPAESTKAAAPPAPAQQQDTTKPAQGADTSNEQPLRDAYHQPPKDTVTQAVYDGWKQFNLNCARCHGEDVSGTTIAPHLIVSLKPDGPINTKELFVQTVCAGRPAKGMPAWCALGLGMDKINDIYLYVKGRSDAKISPGRPAVKPEG
jgi:hypothetical protein